MRSLLPELNASLNLLSGVLLVTGFIFVKQRKLIAHRRAMLAACASSTLFLISYLTYHYMVGSVKFTGQGTVRTVYFTILLTHTVLAMTILPLAIYTVIKGLGGKFEQHKRVARWTLPIWLYVSITGVLVYLFLYQFYPSA
jgi:putative membrane protein